MIEINDGVIFVKGALNGAIYDFNTRKVYSVNDIACEIIDKYINKLKINIDEQEYLIKLESANLINKDFEIHKYIPPAESKQTLEVAWLEVCQTCNLRCIHCYEGEVHKSTKNPVPIEKWKEIVDELLQLGIKRIIIIGGEPCCYKNIYEILEYSSKQNIHVTLFTNATLINKEIIECLKNNKISVKVSLYGHTEKIHDLITQVKGSFNQLLKNVKWLIDEGIEVYASVVIMKENQDYTNEIANFAREIGMKYSRYDVIRTVYGGEQSIHTPDKQQVIESSYLVRPNFLITKEKFDKSCIQNSCWSNKISIMDNGDVIPCEFSRNIIYGNVLESSIKDILKSRAVLNCWKITNDMVKTCCDCEFRYACKDCRPLAMSIDNDFYRKNPRCTYEPVTGTWGTL